MEVCDWSQAHSCGICGEQSDNGTSFSQVLCCCHQHCATKPSRSYSIHLPMMSHDLSNLIKTHSHFKARVLSCWQMAYKVYKPFFWFWKVWVKWAADMDQYVPMHLCMTQTFNFGKRQNTLLWSSPAVKSVCWLRSTYDLTMAYNHLM